MSTTIREAERSELAEVLALLRTCDLPVDGVEENLDGYLVARENETLVGTIGLERYGDAGLLRSLAVAASGRGRGLGGTLVKMLLGYAKERGVSTLYLLTETADTFFPRFGFERMPREDLDPSLEASKELQGACPETAVAMRLRLGHSVRALLRNPH
ncbi:MAG: arsenic resistance N-acetyltransferase ArsN2 [Vicinamibacteria bacterium]